MIKRIWIFTLFCYVIFSLHCDAKENTESDSVPVLVYHRISKEKQNTKWLLNEARFEQQLSYLTKNKYRFLTVSDLFQTWREHKPLPSKSILITFDDTYSDHYQVVFPLLQKYNVKATMFITTNSIGKNNSLSWAQVKEMESSRLIEFGAHSSNHSNLRALSLNLVKKEVGEAKLQLEKKLTKPILAMSYPFGSHSDRIKKITKEAGYKLAFTMHPGFASVSQGLFDLHRIRMTSKTNLRYILSKYYIQLHHSLDYLRPKEF